MYLGIQFRRNLQYVFGNKSGTRIKRIFTEITKRTNKKQSVSFSFCLDKTYHPLWLMKLHHRRHFASYLSHSQFPIRRAYPFLFFVRFAFHFAFSFRLNSKGGCSSYQSRLEAQEHCWGTGTKPDVYPATPYFQVSL